MNKQSLSTKKLLVICGPTATGKTDLGLYLAKKFKGDILSADSKQAYKGMNIITGKDLPVNSKFHTPQGVSLIPNIKHDRKKLGFWMVNDVRVWLTDLVDPKEEFSVAQWNRAAQAVIKELWQEGRLPIVVGGTGFYIKALVDGVGTIEIPQNKESRASLSGKNAAELFEILARLDGVRAAGMNQSDRKNPRRLLRAIEVADWLNANKMAGARKTLSPFDTLFVGIEAPPQDLRHRVEERVEKRIKHGGLDEITKLLKTGVSWDHQSMGGLGYRQLRGFFEGKLSLKEARSAWISAEQKYAREQLAWFKKDKRVNWFDITKRSWKSEVEKLVENWYTTN